MDMPLDLVSLPAESFTRQGVLSKAEHVQIPQLRTLLHIELLNPSDDMYSYGV